jgi:hypothetical protein
MCQARAASAVIFLTRLCTSKRAGPRPALFEELSYEKLKKGNYVNQKIICCLQEILYNENMS